MFPRSYCYYGIRARKTDREKNVCGHIRAHATASVLVHGCIKIITAHTLAQHLSFNRLLIDRKHSAAIQCKRTLNYNPRSPPPLFSPVPPSVDLSVAWHNISDLTSESDFLTCTWHVRGDSEWVHDRHTSPTLSDHLLPAPQHRLRSDAGMGCGTVLEERSRRASRPRLTLPSDRSIKTGSPSMLPLKRGKGCIISIKCHLLHVFHNLRSFQIINTLNIYL